ncbi:EFR3 homolog [Nesidiocoris tenuis]|uniref:EFR3 homolog n=1 Tax=Nesidiocoris tenuis TaxID=355587 RepID=A0ABN7BDZ1_9HEMI|nr:EFR3 homolog [Nesidiocoris tenuis]
MSAVLTCCFEPQRDNMPECVDSMLKKCSDPGCCFSCNCVRPRYKRLVDNIFPPSPQEGLIKSNMEKLTYYSLSSPEKLDRISEYLFQRVSRDISRKRTGYVVMAMEAMDQLLAACHAQTLNLFVESFLKMVQKLLESTEPDLQILATQSFVKFANIEEDTPSYHRRYDFFVSKFSSMCHSNHGEVTQRNMIRLAGIRGLQGVIRKTVSDDLVENIWEPVHMDKIIPSLLFNMQDSKYYETPVVPDEKNNPGVMADACLKELVGRASFGNVKSVLQPVLRHLDNHDLWVPNDFAVHTFRVIMFSIQTQYSYAVVENLMYHLDENSNGSAKKRTSITHVLSKIISISAEECIGPSVLEIINSLLGHIRISAARRQDASETMYMEALISCLGEFTSHLPDYQKVEIMVFILSKIPSESSQTDILLREMLLKSLLIVAKNYTNVSLSSTFPAPLLGPLLRLCSHPETSLLGQEVLQVLLDRHGNLLRLREPSFETCFLVSEPISRPDAMFLKKYEEDFYSSLLLTITDPGHTVRAVLSLYTSLALIAIMINLHTLPSYLALLVRIQDIALNNHSLSVLQKVNLHSLVVILFNLMANLLTLSPLQAYARQIIEKRRANASYMLEDLKDDHIIEELSTDPELMLDETRLAECLRECGLDINTLSRVLSHRHSWIDTSGVSMRGSSYDLTGDLDSANSTPGFQRKCPNEELTFESMKKIITESSEAHKIVQARKQRELFDLFRNSTFEDLVNNNTVKDEDTLHCRLEDILSRAQLTKSAFEDSTPIFETLFPELFSC